MSSGVLSDMTSTMSCKENRPEILANSTKEWMKGGKTANLHTSIKNRMEQLEIEKVQLSLNLHIQEDKERLARVQISTLGSRINEYETQSEFMQSQLSSLKSTAGIHAAEIERL